MQKPEELVRKIKLEEHELNTSLDKLEYFMMSEDFTKISKEQKTLLEQQHKVMTEYKLILIKRAHRINWEAGRDKAAAEIKKAVETHESDLPLCPYNDAGRFCLLRKKDRCLGSGSYCFKDGMESKEAEEGKERIPDEVCRECKYYNAKEDICTNRGNKDGNCWEAKEERRKDQEEIRYNGIPRPLNHIRHGYSGD